MIRKLLLFALLLVGGFAALHYAVGWENLAGTSTVGKEATGSSTAHPDGASSSGPRAGSAGRTPDDVTGELPGDGTSGLQDPNEARVGQPQAGGTGTGVGIPTNNNGTITTEFHGRMQVWLGERLIAHESRTIRLPRATLTCNDSNPLPDGRQRMEDVRVEFFALDKEQARPTNRLVATLTAETAFAELMADRLSGERSVRSDKEMELRGVVIETTAQGSVRSATLRGPEESALAKVFALVLEDRVEIDTEQREPFSFTLDGDRPMRLVGEGLSARMPLGDNPKGRVDLIARYNPTLTQGSGPDALRLTGTEALHFSEVVGSGSAQVTLDGDVAVTIPGSSFRATSPGSGPTQEGETDTDPGRTAPDVTLLRGDRLVARLARGTGRLSGAGRYGTAMLRSLRLRGALATIDSPGLHVECTEVVAIPALDGRPFALSALGSQTTMVIEEDQGRGTTRTEFQAGRHIHVVRPSRYLAPVLGAYGVPTWAAGSLAQRDLVVFDGASHITSYPPPAGGPAEGEPTPTRSRSPSSILGLSSSKGMVLWRGQGDTDPMILRG
ncbi:MAG: hypothetical protein AB8H79_19485, partial [Myxococcota bacterium]